MSGRGGEGMSDSERHVRSAEKEPSIRLELPAGTHIHHDECGFRLPDQRYLRIYEDGVREELRDGMSARGESHVLRPQLFAHRCRVAGNPHSFGPTTYVSLTTEVDVVVHLPQALPRMSDEDLIALTHRIMRSVAELPTAELPIGESSSHVIDLSAALIGGTADAGNGRDATR